jgi:hypothetical protein
MTETPYQARVLQHDDMDAVRELFRDVFREEMPEALWRWKYARELSKGSVVLKDGRIVAHYGGLGRRVLLCGEETVSVQIGDVMVAPSVRQSVRSNSPFFLAYTTFVDSYVGYGKFFPFGFGFPNDRAFRIAEKLGFYAKVGSMSEVSWQAQRRWPAALWRAAELTPAKLPQQRAALDALWREMAAEHGDHIIGIRDADYLDYRYFQRPGKDYRVLLLRQRFSGKLQAVVVLQQRDTRLYLLDYVGRLDRLPGTVRFLRDLAAREGHTGIFTWCATHHRHYFDVDGAVLQPLPIAIPANIWTRGPGPEQLNERWWLMPGDTDFQ